MSKTPKLKEMPELQGMLEPISSLQDRASQIRALQIRGSSVVLHEIYQTHWQDLCGFLRGRYGAGPPEPEDVAQMTFTRFAALKNKEDIRNPRAYLINMAKNIVISDMRKSIVRDKYAKATLLEDNFHNRGYDLTPERVLLEKEKYEVFAKALKTMPRKRRRMLLMNRMHGLSYAEIARRFGVSATTIKKHVARGIRDLDEAFYAAGLKEI